MALFNCTAFENEDSVDFEVTTQTNDLDTGELAVEGSLKIKGVNGVSVAVSGDTVVFGIDPETFPESDAGDGGTDSGDTSGDSTGGGSTGGSGCTCPTIYTANSVEELPDPATVPEGSIGLVPSKSGESSGNDSGGGTGATSWNDLTDKPFGDESVTIEWDGNTEGLVQYGYQYKVSDHIPSLEELQGAKLKVYNAQTNQTLAYDTVMVVDYGGVYSLDTPDQEGMGTVISIGTDGVPSGTYFLSYNGWYISSLTYGSLKKLDPKYLPDDIGGTGFSLPIVELTTKMTYCNAENPSTTTTLSESESAALTEASEAMLPVIVKWSYDSLFPLCSLGNNLAGGHLELGAVYSSDTGAFVRGAVVRKGGTTWEFRLTWTDNA